MTEPNGWRHDRDHVRLLQQAHADHIEAIYRGLASRPDDPDGAEVRAFGATRVFTTRKNRLENRAIFTGYERGEDFDEVFRHFDERGVRCVIEINPANFYPSDPFSWTSDVLPLLMSKGCTIEDFRCVWVCDRALERPVEPRVETFGPDRIDAFVGELDRVYPDDDWRGSIGQLRHGEGGDAWRHYIGYEDDRPVSTGKLFSNGESGFLAWWFTHPDFRWRGHQAAGIRQRTADAFEMGCSRAFTVTDFSTQSSMNLQRCGFRLAYNYVLLYREPHPSGES
jgi:hypothetical protein